MLRFILNYLLLLEIANGADLSNDLSKPHIYLGQDSRLTVPYYTVCDTLKSQEATYSQWP